MKTILLSGIIFLSTIANAQFSETYEEARSQFQEAAKVVLTLNPKAQLQSYAIPASREVDTNLTTDVLYIPAVGEHAKLIIINSGIHGIEGYVGSALQIAFLKSNEWQKISDDTGILLIHAMNPFGFKYRRRSNENNVDLNRNFLVNPTGFETVNTGYREENNLLNPEGPASGNPVDRAWFYMRAVTDIVRYSMKALRQAVLQGQYEFKKGVYFGGNNYEAAKGIFDQIFSNYAQSYSALFLADLHTGYGERGRLHLMSDLKTPSQKAALEAVFPDTPINYGDTKDFYEVHGGLVEYFYHTSLSSEKRVGIVMEYGTLDSQTTLGSLDSVYRMSRENQGYHFGYLTDEANARITTSFSEMFYPTDIGWRNKAIKDGLARIKDALTNFKKGP